MSVSTTSSPEPVAPADSAGGECKLCANCGASLVERFCAACGQRADVGELSARGLISRFFGELTSLEKPLLRTFVGVLRRPGVVAGDYVGGQRVRYTNPIKWALLSTGLAFLVGGMIGSRGARSS